MTTVWCLGILVMACQFPDPPKPTAVICPPLVEWGAAEQRAAGAELARLPAGHPLRRLGVVAVKQRDVVKACRRSQRF